MYPEKLSFPRARKLSTLFSKVEVPNEYKSATTTTLMALIDKNMVLVDNDRIFFEFVAWPDGKTLILAKYNQIIGSRWLAVIPSTEIPKEIR